MRRKNLTGLILLNTVLLMVLGLLCFSPQPAQAQLGGIRGGDYVMIAGRVSGQSTNSIYIVDLNSARMIAVSYDSNRQGIFGQASRDLSSDFPSK